MKLARWILARMLPTSAEGRSMLGDLLEEFHARPRGVRRWVWSWWITLDVTLGYLPVLALRCLGAASQDLRHAGRVARRRPGFVAAIVLSLGSAIGIGTAAFAVANGTWLRRALTDDPAIVDIWRRHANGASKLWPLSEALRLPEIVRSAQLSTIAINDEPVTPRPDDSSDRDVAPVGFVGGNYFAMLEANPSAGRLLTPEDDRDGTGLAAVVDSLYYRRRLGGDAKLLGRTLLIRGEPFTIVGVAGRDFIDPTGKRPSVWTTTAGLRRLPPSAAERAGPNGLHPLVIGRLAPGTSLDSLNLELALRTPEIPPAAGEPLPTGVEGDQVVSFEFIATTRRVLAGVMTTIALVLVLACANVSNLLLAGVTSRRHEIAVRAACGASRARVLSQLMTESFLLGGLSGVVGLLLARVIAPAFAIGMGRPGADVDLDLRICGFVLAAAVLCAIGVGLVPALAAARSDLRTFAAGRQLRTGRDDGLRRTRAVFIAIQAGVSIVLLSLAALQMRALVRLAWSDPGFDVEHLLSVGAPFPESPEQKAAASAFWPQALERIRAVPGVEDASLAGLAPYGRFFASPDPARVIWDPTDAHFFTTAGMHILQGRAYTSDEVATHAKVVVISARAARRFWGAENPVGASAVRIDSHLAGYEVVGVAADAALWDISGVHKAVVYMPFLLVDTANIVVRVNRPAEIAPSVLAAIERLSPSVIPTIGVTSDAVAYQMAPPRRYTALAAGVAGFGLLLSVVGLFGVTSYAVRTSTREIGVRKALGAQNAAMIALFAREALRPALIGLTIGFGVALVADHATASLLYGISERDPLALSAAVAVMIASAGIAVYLPARRVIGLDPAVALRDT